MQQRNHLERNDFSTLCYPQARRWLALLSLTIGLAWTLPLQAKPVVLAAQGALLSQAGIAVDGKYPMAISLYDGINANASFFQQKFLAIAVTGGRFGLELGADPNQLLDGTVLVGKDLYIGVQVSDDPELTRVPYRPVPRAVQADIATNLQCTGCVTTSMLDAAVLQPYAKIANLAKVATSGAYADLGGTPDLSVFAQSSGLAKIATSGSYLDLSNSPDLGVYAKTTNLANVAFSGKYADLAGGPDLSPYAKTGELAKVAMTGAYVDLVGAPDLTGYAQAKNVPVLLTKTASLKDGATLLLAHNANTNGVMAMAWYKDSLGVVRPVPMEKITTSLGSDKDLVGRWNFDGCNAADSTTFANNGVLQNAPACVAGKYGKAYQFDGSSQYVQVANSASLQITPAAMSMGMWVNFAGGAGENITFNKENAYEMKLDNGPLQTAIASGSVGAWAWHSAGSVGTGQWIHVAAIYDGQAVTHYINGVAVGSYPQTGTIPTTNCDLGIGARGLGCGGAAGFFHGSLDEPFLFRRALTLVELQAIVANSWGSGAQWELTQPDANSVALVNHTGATQDVTLVVTRPGG